MRDRNKIAALMLTSVAVLTAGVVRPASARQTGNIGVTVNGEAVRFVGQPPVKRSGRILVPLRGVLEKIGATVLYDGAARTVRAKKGDTDIALTLGMTDASVNGKPVTLDAPAEAVNGATLVPLRFVAESLGANVLFDGKTQTVAIRTDGKPNNPATAPPAETAQGSSFKGIFVDFSGQDNDSYTLKMTDGRTLTMQKSATLLYTGQKIDFDDLRSGDLIVATLDPKTKNGIKATVSDDDL